MRSGRGARRFFKGAFGSLLYLAALKEYLCFHSETHRLKIVSMGWAKSATIDTTDEQSDSVMGYVGLILTIRNERSRVSV